MIFTQSTPLVFAVCMVGLTTLTIVFRTRPTLHTGLVIAMCAFAILIGYLPFKIVPRLMTPAGPTGVSDNFRYFDAWHAGRVAVLDELNGYTHLILLSFACLTMVAIIGKSQAR